MSTFAAGATLEQRYPGESEEAARAAARPRVAAFEAAGWTVASEEWVVAALPSTQADPLPPGAGRYAAARGGALVVTFLAARDAEVPPALGGMPAGEAPRGGPSRYTLRIVIALVVIAAVMVLFVLLVSTPTGAALPGLSALPHLLGAGPA